MYIRVKLTEADGGAKVDDDSDTKDAEKPQMENKTSKDTDAKGGAKAMDGQVTK